MSWEAVRRRRLPLHFLRGTYAAVALTHPKGFDRKATFLAIVDLHALRFSAENGLHSVYVANRDEEEVEVDHWSADLDINEQNQMKTFPFWDLDRFFEQNCRRPVKPVIQVDPQTLILTAWFGWDRLTPRQFRLTKVSDRLWDKAAL